MSTADSHLGYHYFPDDRHYTQADLGNWLPVFDSLGARWVVLCASAQRAVPEAFLRGLIQAGLEPVVHMALRVSGVSLAEMTPLLTSYAHWGVRFVVVGDRPNMRANWLHSEWSRPGLAERFVEEFLPILQVQRAVGLRPTLPPLEPGGDYWDTSFLPAVLEALDRRGHGALLQELTLALYAWTFDHPLDWGAGGPDRWPGVRPYHTPEGSQDHRGFRIFEWYSAAVRSSGMERLPMLVIAGGALRSVQRSVLSPDLQSERNLAIARAFVHGEIPDDVLNFAFYPLVVEAGHPDEPSAWFPPSGEPRPVVTAIRRLVDASHAGAPRRPDKPLKHYLLLPAGLGTSLLQEWDVLSEFAAAHRPTVGFSPEEARWAEQVTIAGDEAAVSLSVEESLRAAGCRVQRFVRGETAVRLDPCSIAIDDGTRGPLPATGVSHASGALLEAQSKCRPA
jgi:hypothetical protein